MQLNIKQEMSYLKIKKQQTDGKIIWKSYTVDNKLRMNKFIFKMKKI